MDDFRRLVACITVSCFRRACWARDANIDVWRRMRSSGGANSTSLPHMNFETSKQLKVEGEISKVD